jgi:hypothetical protein
MKKAAMIWLITALLMLFVAGIVGDWIFAPHPQDFSFRTLSNYSIAAVMLICAVIAWNAPQ